MNRSRFITTAAVLAAAFGPASAVALASNGADDPVRVSGANAVVMAGTTASKDDSARAARRGRGRDDRGRDDRGRHHGRHHGRHAERGDDHGGRRDRDDRAEAGDDRGAAGAADDRRGRGRGGDDD